MAGVMEVSDVINDTNIISDAMTMTTTTSYRVKTRQLAIIM
jgi:hypothetical protein